MIPLILPSTSDAVSPFVTRLGAVTWDDSRDARLMSDAGGTALYSGDFGLFTIERPQGMSLEGDIVLVDPCAGRAERLIRAGSGHNTLLVTERCDQLCVMCSQPPKKTHEDRFAAFTDACLLAPDSSVIGISGGEPTLFKAELLELLETVLSQRPDLAFHILSNGQHFEQGDVERLRQPCYQRVQWGIPVYSADHASHDQIVAKEGALARLEKSFCHLLAAGTRIELRTVLLSDNYNDLLRLARYVATRLPFIEHWSIMQLENAGFAKNRWDALYVDHQQDFAPLGQALDHAILSGLDVRLFNVPRCSVPQEYRRHAMASISDWKRRYAPACAPCNERDQCGGFFEWHPKDADLKVVPL